MQINWLETDFYYSAASAGDALSALRISAQAYMVQCQLQNKPYSPVDFADFARNDGDLPSWLTDCITLEAAIAKLPAANSGPNFSLKSASLEMLGQQQFCLAEHCKLQAATVDLAGWYLLASAGNAQKPAAGSCYILVQNNNSAIAITKLNAGQYQLLNLFTSGAMLAVALDQFVTSNSDLASANAKNIGPWLEHWLNKGIIYAA